MTLTRRQFLLLTAGLAAGCQSPGPAGTSAPSPGGMVSAGPAADYAAEGVYTRFQNQGFFLIRRDGRLFALSSICTHRKCKLKAERDHSFYCPCHGSTFDPAGHVTEGPARHDLPELPVTVDAHDRLQVTLPGA